LSNVIKSYTVCYDKNLTKTIDSHQTWKEKEVLAKQSIPVAADRTEGFVSGLDALQVKELPSKEEKKENADQILEKAKKEAEQIRNQAKQEALDTQKEIYEEARKKGYEDGTASGMQELQKKTEALDNKLAQLQKDYEDMVKELEPQIAEIIAELVENVTGIFVEDRKDVIVYLVEKALKNQEKCNDFTIRVAKEDYDLVSRNKDLLLASIGREIQLRITEDAALIKNECFIETDLSVINCSLDEQMANLIKDIRLLGGAALHP